MRSIMTSRKRRRRTPDQIIRKLAEGNKLLAASVVAPLQGRTGR
jgi:hypothetical protein